MMDFIWLTIVIALFASFVILLIEKVGYREEIQIKAPKLISELFSCDFCLSWWTCFFMALIICLLDGNLSIILCAVSATPITRKML